MADPECARVGAVSHILAEKRGVSFTLFQKKHENAIFSPRSGGRTPGTPYAGSATGAWVFLPRPITVYPLAILKRWKYVCTNHGNQRVFEIIINASSFRFIWISMLQVCGDYKYFYSFSAGIDMIRQNLTSTDCRRQILTNKVDPRALRAKICTAEFILLVSIFHSFEAGIADKISGFKWWKHLYSKTNKHLQYWIIGLLNLAWNRIYTVPAAQGLKLGLQ